MKMNKKTILPIIVLTSICIVVALLMGIVNMITAPRIEANALKKEQAALFAVFPTEEDGFDEMKNLEGLPQTVKTVYKAKGGAGFAISVATRSSYSSGDMTFVVGIDNDGKIVGITLNNYQESKDFGKDYPQNFIGKNADDYESVETVSGVTYSSTAFKSAVGDAITAVKIAQGEAAPEAPAEPETPSLARDESEILSLAGELVSGSVGFEKIEISGENESLIALYRENGGKGYVAYVLVISANYGTVESEALIHIGNNGKISGLNKLTWKTSDAMYGYVPPTAEEVDAFYSRLSGASSSTIDSVELVTNATNTSTNVVKSFKEALAAADEAIKKDMPTPESELLELAETLMGAAADFENITPDENQYLKRLYKDKGGKGYIAYVVVISANYGTVESEALIHIGNNGKISGLNKLTWKTSDAMYGYVPPTAEEVDAFYNRLSGASSSTIDAVELVTNATNTSTNVINSFKEALTAVDAVRASEKSIAPRVIGITVLVVAVGSFVAFFVYNRKRRAPYEK